MDHSLDDSLNLDSAMGVDFEPPGDTVVGQGDISLDAGSHEVSMPMEFESIEEQPMLMDAENEQIIGYSDDQFNLQEYGVQHQDEPAGANTTVVSTEQPMSQSDTMLDIQFDPQVFTSSPIKIEPQVQQVQPQPKIIAVRAALPPPRYASAAPRQVAIAPKPAAGAGARPPGLGLKPLSLAARPHLVKKVSLAGVQQGKTVLAQIGKQLVMVPGSNQKIKLVAAPGGVPGIQYLRANQDQPRQGQLIAAKSLSGTKPVLTKFIIQGQHSDSGSQPAVLTKLVSAQSPARFVTMAQKTVPISMPNKVHIAIRLMLGQHSESGSQPAVLTKLVSAQSPARFVTMAQKTVPISMPNKVHIAIRLMLGQHSESGSQPAVLTKLVSAQSPARFVTMAQKTVPISMPNKVHIAIRLMLGQHSESGSQPAVLTKLVSAQSPARFVTMAQKTVPISMPNKVHIAIRLMLGQHSESGSQPAVLTKLVSAQSPARFVTMAQKTVPISMPNKVLVASPTKQTVRITKKQHVVEIKSPTATKFMPTTQVLSSGGAKKVVITATPTQNVILKTTAPPKAPQMNKDGNITVQGQRTQLHQINVPGKGIQYIRLVTAGGGGGGAPRLQPRPAHKTVVLADAKGNVIQMAAEKVQTGQPPPLVISGPATALNKLTAARPQQKLVRIAPVGSKPALAATSGTRPMQSLLAPLSAAAPAPAPAAAPAPAPAPAAAPAAPHAEEAAGEDEVDSKAALQALLAEADRGEADELEIEFERRSGEGDSSNSLEQSQETGGYKDALEPLIVIPNYLKQQESADDDYAARDKEERFNNFDAQSFNSYQAPPTPQAVSESDLVTTELGMRPRKACNCTKSQCLKLYCDCFANGEFCHQCNCNNCHNNLENEELRQKAIRGCLDRNPNAFRPKIGKAKSGGPEIVRRHNKGCNCKRSGCLKNYCECYEAKIACTAMCKCVGCRNVEESLARRRDRARDPVFRPAALPHINFMTTEVIEAVCQCLIAACAEPAPASPPPVQPDPVRDVIDEFSRCLQDIINAAHHSAPMLDESRA